MPMTLSTISAGSVICSTCASSSTLFASGVPSRRRARRAAMQLNLDFFDQPDVPPSAPVTWEQIDEAARIAAIELLARLISRLLQNSPSTEASDE
jgi:hypothetical protein